jgi:membrane-bound lytic murein transglycosylase D
MRANNLRRSNYIVAGKLLKIPKNGWVSTAPRQPARPAGEALHHRVRKGDSLWIIAQRYGTTTKRIKDLNKLRTNHLHIGQVLLISPGKKQRAPEKTMVARSTYRVQPGDSPFVIAKRHNMSLERLLDINQLSDRTTIYPGQELHVE